MNNKLFIGALVTIILLAATCDAQSSLASSYLGAGDTGVDHYPVYLGLKLHIRCYTNTTSVNANGPTALFDAGLPFFSTAWVSIIPSVLANMQSWNFSKACFIDRYGYGWSDAAPYPFTTQEYVGRLHASLGIASLSGPYVLVGWSWGSIMAQVFAVRYPSEVAGILTCDGTDSAWGFYSSNMQAVMTLTNLFVNYLTLNQQGTLATLANNGSIPLPYGFFPNSSVSLNFTQGSVSASQQIWLTNKYLTTAIQEYNIMVPSTMLLNFTYILMGTPTPLKDCPWVVLYENTNGQDWMNRQVFQSHLSTNSESFVVSTDHFMPWSAQFAIVEGLQKIANRIKNYPAVLFGH